MAENRTKYDDQVSAKEVVADLKNWVSYFLQHKTIIVLVSFGFAISGFVYAMVKKPAYLAECTFVLQDDSRSMLGQYSGIASVFGLNLDGGTSGLFQGDNIIELYKSRSMIERTLLSRAEDNKDLLIDRFLDFSGIRKNLNEQDDAHLRSIKFDIPKDQFTIKHDSIITGLVKLINKKYLDVSKPDKKLNIISVKVTAPDQIFAKDFALAIVDNVNRFYVQAKTEKSVRTVSVLQHQADSVRIELNKAIGGVASSIDQNPNPNMALQSLRVPSQKKQIDANANSAMYAEIVKNLELSKLALRQETPLIQVIDKPVLPLDKMALGKIIAALIGCFFGGCIALTYLIIKKSLSNNRD